MHPAVMLIGLANLGLASPSDHSAADSVTLRDGKVVLGQVVDSDRGGPLVMLVRRAWVEANLPARANAWAKLEAPITTRAQAHRRDRLVAWRRDRRPDPAQGDRITIWIDRELVRLADPKPASSPLMVARITRNEVKTIDRKPRRANRMLRLGWLSDFPDVETMPLDDLTRGLEARGFSAEVDAPISLDALLPDRPETDAQWLVRRAATEVANDPGARLIRYQGMVLAEPAAGEAPPVAAGLNAALGTIKELLGETPDDPLPGKLRELAGEGRVGVVVTAMNLAPDFSGVQVDSTLWVRAGDRWNPAFVRSSAVRSDDLPADAGVGLADDPQVKAVFGMVEKLGLGQVSPDLQRRGLAMGAATRQALGQARAALDQEMNAVALSLEAPRQPRR